MFVALLFLFLALLVFLILTEIITVDILYEEYTIVEISLMIFALRLTFKRNLKEQSKKKKRKKRDFNTLTSFFVSIAKSSNIIIRKLIYKIPNGDPAENALRFGIYSSAVSSTIALIQENAKNFTADNIITDYSEHNKSSLAFDAQIEISALNFLICLAGYVIKASNRKIFKKRGKNYGRKQNE